MAFAAQESPGLSLGGLLFGYTLLNIYMMTAFLALMVSYRKDAQAAAASFRDRGHRAGHGWEAITAAADYGEHCQGRLAQFTVCVSGLRPFWRGVSSSSSTWKKWAFPSHEGGGRSEQVAGQAEHADVLDGLADRGTGDALRELGADQAAGDDRALLARKTPDTTICYNLNISPSTLKIIYGSFTARLGISSRHELAWLVTANPAGHFRKRRGVRPLAIIAVQAGGGWRDVPLPSGRQLKLRRRSFWSLFCLRSSKKWAVSR